MQYRGDIIELLEILEKLLVNHKNTGNIDEYLIQKDFIEMSNYSSSTVNRRFDKLREKGWIKEHKPKTTLYNSMNKGSGKVFVPTLAGLEHRGLTSKFHEITEGSADESLFNKFGIGLADMHGKLYIKIPINESPEPEGDKFPWKDKIDMRHGVKKYISHIFNMKGDEVSLEMTLGEKKSSVMLKPRFISKFDDTPEKLINKFIDVGWAIWQDMRDEGYDLGLPSGPHGEAKFTLTCKHFESIGYTEGKNILVDYSNGKAELHPQTGDLKANQLMARILLDSKVVRKKVEKNILSDEEKVEVFEEVGEMASMREDIRKTKKKTEKNDEKTDRILNHLQDMSQSQQSMAQTQEKLTEVIEWIKDTVQGTDGSNEQQQQQYDKEPPGGMYG